MTDIYVNNHLHNATNCTFADCVVVTQSLPSNLEEEANAANNTLIRESAGVSPAVAARFGFNN